MDYLSKVISKHLDHSNEVVEEIPRASIMGINKSITMNQPYKVIKEDSSKGKEMLETLGVQLWYIALGIEPFMPNASLALQEALRTNTTLPAPLFPRIAIEA
jgi:methionyl-tRNA synthetase